MNGKEAREFLEYAIEHPNPNGNLTDEHTQTAIQVITIALKAFDVCDRIKDTEENRKKAEEYWKFNSFSREVKV